MTSEGPVEKLRQKFQIRTKLTRNLLSEFFGTAILLFIGIAVVMQFILSKEKVNAYVQINIGWGLGIAFSVYLCAKTSGGHFNPGVSLAMVTLGKLSIKDFFLYFIVQTFGAFVGSAGAYGIYYDQFQKFSGDARYIAGLKGTAACFASFPAAHVSHTTAFFDQIAGTGLLVLFVCCIIDKRSKIPAAAHPLLFGLVVMMIGTCFALNLGYPINPARDLGPRIFAYFIYGSGVFTYQGYYFWIPVIAPLVGGPLGAWLYQIFVGIHVPDEEVVYLEEERKALKNGDDV
jgi:MIP family channel proteins